MLRQISYDDLELGNVIGRGGEGEVYRAVCHSLAGKLSERLRPDPGCIDGTVAVKKASNNYEGEMLGRISHRNIIRFYGLTQNNSCYYLVVELASRGSLYDHIIVNKHQPNFIDIIHWAKDIACGMNYLHSEAPDGTILHRDLKSKNVLLTHSYICKLCDFGHSHLNENTDTLISDTLFGSYRWMAPETIAEQKYSIGSDVWSFGVVLWEMLTQQVPYPAMNDCSVIYTIGKYIKLPIPDGCPVEFKQILQRCWEYKASDRPPFNVLLKDIEKLSLPDSQLPAMTATFLSNTDQIRSEIKDKMMKKMREVKQPTQADFDAIKRSLVEAQEVIRNQQQKIRGFKKSPSTSNGLSQDFRLDTMTEYDVANYLKRLTNDPERHDIAPYAELFEQNHITGNRLAYLTEMDLAALGVVPYMHRRMLWSIIDEIKYLNYLHTNFPALPRMPSVPSFHRLDEVVAGEKTEKIRLHVQYGIVIRRYELCRNICPEGKAMRWKPVLFVDGIRDVCLSLSPSSSLEMAVSSAVLPGDTADDIFSSKTSPSKLFIHEEELIQRVSIRKDSTKLGDLGKGYAADSWFPSKLERGDVIKFTLVFSDVVQRPKKIQRDFVVPDDCVMGPSFSIEGDFDSTSCSSKSMCAVCQRRKKTSASKRTGSRKLSTETSDASTLTDKTSINSHVDQRRDQRKTLAPKQAATRKPVELASLDTSTITEAMASTDDSRTFLFNDFDTELVVLLSQLRPNKTELVSPQLPASQLSSVSSSVVDPLHSVSSQASYAKVAQRRLPTSSSEVFNRSDMEQTSPMPHSLSTARFSVGGESLASSRTSSVSSGRAGGLSGVESAGGLLTPCRPNRTGQPRTFNTAAGAVAQKSGRSNSDVSGRGQGRLNAPSRQTSYPLQPTHRQTTGGGGSGPSCTPKEPRSAEATFSNRQTNFRTTTPVKTPTSPSQPNLGPRPTKCNVFINEPPIKEAVKEVANRTRQESESRESVHSNQSRTRADTLQGDSNNNSLVGRKSSPAGSIASSGSATSATTFANSSSLAANIANIANIVLVGTKSSKDPSESFQQRQQQQQQQQPPTSNAAVPASSAAASGQKKKKPSQQQTLADAGQRTRNSPARANDGWQVVSNKKRTRKDDK